MHSRILSLVVAAGLSLSLSSALHAQAPDAGTVKAARIRGDVTLTDITTQASQPLKTGDVFGPKHDVTTAVQSSAIMLMSNGASITVGASSKITIDDYLQDPFVEEFDPSKVTKEPTTSHTKLTLDHGDITAQVKKLDVNNGSLFEVETRVGVAGIRGTTFQLSLHVMPDGTIAFSIKLVEGEMYYRPAGGGETVKIMAGDDFEIRGTVDPATGEVSVSFTTAELSAEATTIIGDLVAEAHDAEGGITFNPSNTGPITLPVPPPMESVPETTGGAGSQGSGG